MLIEYKTDNHIQGGPNLKEMIETTVEGSISRFGEQVTRVQVNLSDANSHKSGGNDKHCTMEARVAGYQPVAVSSDATTIDEAVSSCADKLAKLLDHRLGKLADRKGRTSMAGDEVE